MPPVLNSSHQDIRTLLDPCHGDGVIGVWDTNVIMEGSTAKSVLVQHAAYGKDINSSLALSIAKDNVSSQWQQQVFSLNA